MAKFKDIGIDVQNNERTPMTKLEIIEETAKFYSKDPLKRRSLFEGNCMYNTPNGNHCAIGRCLMPRYHKQGTDLEGNLNGLHTLLLNNEIGDIDKMLSKRYRGHSRKFWGNLQTFHDHAEYWDNDNKSLTEQGTSYLNDFKTKVS